MLAELFMQDLAEPSLHGQKYFLIKPIGVRIA